MSTDFAALDALHPLPAEELYRQWVLTPDSAGIPAEWERRSSNGWHLGAHPDAQVCDLLANDGTPLGWVIDPLLYLDEAGGAIPTDRLVLPLGPDAGPQELERALYGRDPHGRSSGRGLEGSWAAVVFGGSSAAPFQRVYLGATHSVMYSEEQRIVTTSHNLVSDVRRDEVLSRAVDPLAGRAYYTFGLTAFENLRRLLPNHYLDLDTFRATRHWPQVGFEAMSDGAEAAAVIVEHARRLLRVLSTGHRSFRVFLSAGRDSRAVLALLRPLVREGSIDVALATSVGEDFPSRTDLQAARRLARIAGLPHQITRRPQYRTEDADVMRAFVRIGEARGGKRLAAPRIGRQRPRESRFALGGMAGETARAFFWTPAVAEREVTPEFVAAQTRLPVTGQVVEAVAEWLDALPADVRGRVADTMDLAYVEQRMGCWEFASRYLFSGPMTSTSPMATALSIERMLCLPEHYRAAGRLQRDMVAYGWPELLAVPFNEPTGLLRLQRDVDDLWSRALRRLSRK